VCTDVRVCACVYKCESADPLSVYQQMMTVRVCVCVYDVRVCVRVLM